MAVNQDISELARSVLKVSRNTLAIHLRFMDMAISRLQWVPIPEAVARNPALLPLIGTTLATEGTAILYDPVALCRMYVEEKNSGPRAYLHLLLHGVFRHFYANANVDQNLWDLACDMAVEGVINDLNLPAVMTSGVPNQQAELKRIAPKVKNLLTAEKIYAYLRTNPPRDKELAKLKQLFSPDVDGKSFVTARGWEDLSRMIRLYEMNKIPVDKLLISQYLQDGKIAADFAQYYDLFCKYRSDYQVASILEGKASDEIKQRAKKAKFDERLALIGLLLDAMHTSVQDVMDEYAASNKLMDAVRAFRMKQVREKLSLADAVNATIDDKRKELAAGKRASSMSTQDQRVLRKLIEWMQEEFKLLAGVADAEAFPVLKKDFDARVKNLKKDAEETGKQMSNMFFFAEDVFGEGQEMLILVTELTAAKDTADFISKFGCKEYFRHNKDLLLYERQGEIAQALKQISLDE